MKNRNFKRGEIYWFDFGIAKGSEQGGIRPAMIIQNDIGNKYSPTVIVCPITSQIKKKEWPTHVYLSDYIKYGLRRPSQVITEQMKTTDKSQLGDYIGIIDKVVMDRVDKAIEISVNVGSAKHLSEPREIKVIKEKVEDIKDLDRFISMWFSKNNDTERIQDYIEDREIAIKDLEKYAEMNNINYRKYYSHVNYNRSRMAG